MSVYIKNADTVAHTYQGQIISAGSYYLIPADKLTRWSSDDDLLTDIGAEKAVVAKSDDGTTDLGINDGVDYLKGLTVPLTTPVGVMDPCGYRARLAGLANGTATKNTTTDFDYKMEQLSWLGVNKLSYFDGVRYYAKNAEMGDTVTFQVVDKDGVAYPAGTVLETFAEDWGVVPDTLDTIRLFRSKMAPGFYIRVKYKSVGTTNDVPFLCDLFQFVKTDENA